MDNGWQVDAGDCSSTLESQFRKSVVAGKIALPAAPLNQFLGDVNRSLCWSYTAISKLRAIRPLHPPPSSKRLRFWTDLPSIL